MSERPKPTPVALYARVSSDRQDVDLSVAAQLRALRDYADKNGYVVFRAYVDEVESGRVDDRPEFNKMIDEASSPKATFREILVWKFSRFTRKREHAVAYKSMLRRKGVRVVSITEHADDTPSGKLLEGIIESVDEFYSENLAQEVLRGMREAASRGFWITGSAPYGYRKIMVQDGAKKRVKLEPEEIAAQVVKRIFKLAELGSGMMDIARELNDEGISSPRGKPWGKTSVHAILINEVYTGTLVWGTNAKDGADPVRVEKAFPGIVSTAQFNRVSNLMRSRAPKVVNPRRVGSPFLLSRLIKCGTCNRALSGQYAKSGRYAYYVCQSLIKLGKGACKTRRLNARRFEELVVGRIRISILSATIIGDFKKVVSQELGELIREQRRRLDTIEFELADVRRRLGRLWDLVETTDDDLGDTTQRIRATRDRYIRLEASQEEAKVILSQRRAIRDDVETIIANALDVTEFLKESELSERKAFAETFVREIVVTPDRAVIYYNVSMPTDSPTPGADTEEVPWTDQLKSAFKTPG